VGWVGHGADLVVPLLVPPGDAGVLPEVLRPGGDDELLQVNRAGVSGDSDVPRVFRSRVAGLWSCYGLGAGDLQFVFDGGEHAEGGVAGLGEGGVLTVVGGLQFGGRDVPAGFVEPPVVEPVDMRAG
jgi:hypothetical protein